MDESKERLGMKSRGALLLFVVALVVASMVGSSRGAASPKRVPALRASSSKEGWWRFPLWKDVPGRPFVVLGKGVRHGAQWAVFASNGSGTRRGHGRPCITVARFTADDRYGNATGCGPLVPFEGHHQRSPIHPLIGENGASFFGLSFSPNVVRVEVELEPERLISQVPNLLSVAQGKKAHLKRFRYLAMSVDQPSCIEDIRGYNASGHLILNASTGDCPLLYRRK